MELASGAAGNGKMSPSQGLCFPSQGVQYSQWVCACPSEENHTSLNGILPAFQEWHLGTPKSTNKQESAFSTATQKVRCQVILAPNKQTLPSFFPSFQPVPNSYSCSILGFRSRGRRSKTPPTSLLPHL